MFDFPRRVLTSGEPVLCSQGIILGYAAWFCVGVSTGGVPCHYGPGLDGNDPLLSLRLYSFIFCVVSVLCPHRTVRHNPGWAGDDGSQSEN